MSFPISPTTNGGPYGNENSESFKEQTHEKNPLRRFEESLGKLNPPKWIAKNTTDPSSQADQSSKNWRASSADHYRNGKSSLNSTTSSTSHRFSYADYKRNHSAQRHATSYWSDHGRVTSSRPHSREPSPVPTWSRPPTAPAGSHFSRWSASTLCDSAYSGQNTPTDSVVSGRSLTDGFSRGYSRSQKPYLGWRSQENVSDNRYGKLTPAERLASSLRRSQQGGLNSSYGGLSSSQVGCLQGGPRTSMSRFEQTPGPPEWFVQDSIRSVSNAIAEFCKAEDVPAPTLSYEERMHRRQYRPSKNRPETVPRSRLVWLESSFVSSTTTVNKC